jgi:hypothetical protein
MVFLNVMKPRRLLLPVVAFALISFHASAQETTLQGEPFGYVKLSIAPGTGTTKRNTLLSIPLLDEANITGKSSGRITGVTSNTITASGAGWAAGQLSVAAAPFLLEITSGNAQGRMLLISTATANTTDTVTLDAQEAQRAGDLRELGIVADAQNGSTYRIRPVDTLSSFFGTPATTLIQGGGGASTADTVTIVMNGTAANYFYSTTLGRWTKVGLGSENSSNVPLLPYAGLQYARLPNTPLEFIVTGKVPSGQRRVAIRKSGTTILSPFWPVSQTLASLGLQNTPGWTSGASPTTADTLVLSSGGSVTTFFYDGTNWRRTGLGSPVSNTNVVPAGTALLINRRGSATTFDTYQQNAPYNLQ